MLLFLLFIYFIIIAITFYYYILGDKNLHFNKTRSFQRKILCITVSPLIKENSACAAIAQANLYNDLPARSKFILLTKLHDVTLVLIEIKCLYNNVYLDVKAHKEYYFKTQVIC